MAKGNYDHAGYLVRQQINLGKTTAGASGTSCQFATPVSDIDVRAVSALIITAGTSTDTMIIQSGTSSIGNIVLGTQTANSVVVSADCNTKVTQGSVLNIKNGADATRVVQVTVEANLDPSTSWT